MIIIKRCIIICAYNEYSIKDAVSINESDYIICADAGIDLAQKESIYPDLVIGDFDSLGVIPTEYKPIVLPVEKDDTDTLFCVKYAIEKGFKNIIIVGGIGGRLDQTIANIQTLKYAYQKGCNAWLCDGHNKLTYLKNSTITINKYDNYKLSIFAYNEGCYGVTISGTKYKLENAVLTNDYPIGVSNEFEEDKAIISVTDGELLIVISRDKNDTKTV